MDHRVGTQLTAGFGFDVIGRIGNRTEKLVGTPHCYGRRVLVLHYSLRSFHSASEAVDFSDNRFGSRGSSTWKACDM